MSESERINGRERVNGDSQKPLTLSLITKINKVYNGSLLRLVHHINLELKLTY